MSEHSIKSIRFDNMSFGYDQESLLFREVSFEFPLNEMVWIHAPSGTGRSSLLQILAALKMPNSGQYFVNDNNVADMTAEEFLPYRLKIGYGFDFGGLLNNRTLLENMTLPLVYHKILSQEKAEERALEYMAYMGLKRYKDSRPAVVSGGVRKLICMLRAMVHHPELILLDDPSVGLNEEAFLKYFALLKMIKEFGDLKHIFVSSYDQKMMTQLGAREVVIDDGKLYLNDICTYDPSGERLGA